MDILNFGSLNLDLVYAVDHFVRAGETLSSDSLTYFRGGKGLNQSLALARAGLTVSHAGCIGADGKRLTALLRQAGVDTAFVQTVSQPTGHAIIQVDRTGQNCILLFGGANRCVDENWARQVIFDFDGDWLLLQNEINGLKTMIEAAHQRGMHIAFNPSPVTPELRSLPLQLIDCFLVNEIEGEALTGQSQPEAILNAFQTLYPAAAVVLTCGSAGAYFADAQTRVYQPAFETRVVDTTGAGDTFTGYFLAGYSRGVSPAVCMRTAAMAASIAVSSPGAGDSIPRRERVEQALRAMGHGAV